MRGLASHRTHLLFKLARLSSFFAYQLFDQLGSACVSQPSQKVTIPGYAWLASHRTHLLFKLAHLSSFFAYGSFDQLGWACVSQPN